MLHPGEAFEFLPRSTDDFAYLTYCHTGDPGRVELTDTYETTARVYICFFIASLTLNPLSILLKPHDSDRQPAVLIMQQNCN